MKRFVKIEYHDFMDLKPTIEVRVFEGIDGDALKKNVNDHVAHMKSHWCSGTTRLIGILEQPEALKWIEEQIHKEYDNWKDDSKEFIDKICRFFKECYGEDANIEKLLNDYDDYLVTRAENQDGM